MAKWLASANNLRFIASPRKWKWSWGWGFELLGPHSCSQISSGPIRYTHMCEMHSQIGPLHQTVDIQSHGCNNLQLFWCPAEAKDKTREERERGRQRRTQRRKEERKEKMTRTQNTEAEKQDWNTNLHLHLGFHCFGETFQYFLLLKKILKLVSFAWKNLIVSFFLLTVGVIFLQIIFISSFFVTQSSLFCLPLGLGIDLVLWPLCCFDCRVVWEGFGFGYYLLQS